MWSALLVEPRGHWLRIGYLQPWCHPSWRIPADGILGTRGTTHHHPSSRFPHLCAHVETPTALPAGMDGGYTSIHLLLVDRWTGLTLEDVMCSSALSWVALCKWWCVLAKQLLSDELTWSLGRDDGNEDKEGALALVNSRPEAPSERGSSRAASFKSPLLLEERENYAKFYPIHAAVHAVRKQNLIDSPNLSS